MNLKFGFALVALCPLIYAMGGNGAMAQERTDLARVALTQIEDNAGNRSKYAFTKPVFDEIAAKNFLKNATRVFVGEFAAGKDQVIFFQRVEGPIHCGANSCLLNAYTQANGTFDEVLEINATDEIYARECNGEVSLFFAGPGEPAAVGQWDLTPKDGFTFTKKHTGLDKIPVCKPGN